MTYALVRRPLTVGFLVVAALASPASAAEDAHPGRELFLRYCASCHGTEAKGDGSVADLLRRKPADLTGLAARNGGEFPIEQVTKAIDGRQMLRAHGRPQMPVWGQILSDELGSKGKNSPGVERRVAGRIFTIADYLRTIQTK